MMFYTMWRDQRYIKWFQKSAQLIQYLRIASDWLRKWRESSGVSAARSMLGKTNGIMDYFRHSIENFSVGYPV